MTNIPPAERIRILNIALEARRKYSDIARHCDMTGFCGPISARISNELEEAGIEHVLVTGYFILSKEKDYGHLWIEFPQYDNAVLDATATQFGNFPPIWFPADSRYYSDPRKRIRVGSRYVIAPRQERLPHPSLRKARPVRVRAHQKRRPHPGVRSHRRRR